MLCSLRSLALTSVAPFYIAALLAQETTGSLPYSLQMAWDDSDVPTIEAGYFDAEAVAFEDAERDLAGVLQYYGRFVSCAATPETLSICW